MTAVDERAAAAAPDGGAPQHAQLRAAREVRPGWHVQVAGRFLRVEKIDEKALLSSGQACMWFDDDSMLACRAGERLWTRDPGEQIAYISALLPTHHTALGCRLPNNARLATLYGGSAPGRIGDGAP